MAPAEVTALVEARTAARAARDWARADALRAELEALGWDVTDTPDGAELTRRGPSPSRVASGAVDRPSIPGFLRDLDREPGAVRTLGIASLSLVAAGLNPRVFSPGLSSVQAAVRENSQAEALLLIATSIGGGLLLIGGVLGDADGRRRLLLGALGTMLVSAVIGLFVTDGPVFVISRIVGLSAASIILPIALAGVAGPTTGSRGRPRSGSPTRPTAPRRLPGRSC